MDSGNHHIVQLLEKFSRGEATPADTNQLLDYLQEEGHNEAFIGLVEQQLSGFQPDNAGEFAYWKEKLQGGAARITGVQDADHSSDFSVQTRPVHRMQFLRKWCWAAAAVLIMIGTATYFLTSNSNQSAVPVMAADSTHIEPGKSGAVLTLADGTQVVLDSLGNGIVATQNGTQVMLKGGQLAYAPAGATNGITYNTMTTPKGRQFQLTLPDGTRVWLNAASSLRYPTSFTGNDRQVAVTGEAYFEVARNSRQPFKVNVNDKAMVEVLGTQFNVNAYDNETNLQTTLLTGSVRVGNNNNNNPTVTLKPGQQASMANAATGTGIKVINEVDIKKVMSWKNGLFNFEGASLSEVMRQIERWYDIEVVYEKGIPNVEFEGKMTKDVPLKDLLTMLDRSDVHFRIENRRLIVLP